MAGPWQIVAVESLPWPHLLFKCKWAARFTRVNEAQTTEAGRRAATRALAESLSAAEIAQCPYHVTDWHAAAAAAVALVEAGDTSPDACVRAGRERGLDACAREALYSLFAEPVFCNGDSLGNGQHRVCAMKLAGVSRCPIEE